MSESMSTWIVSNENTQLVNCKIGFKRQGSSLHVKPRVPGDTPYSLHLYYKYTHLWTSHDIPLVGVGEYCLPPTKWTSQQTSSHGMSTRVCDDLSVSSGWFFQTHKGGLSTFQDPPMSFDGWIAIVRGSCWIRIQHGRMLEGFDILLRLHLQVKVFLIFCSSKKPHQGHCTPNVYHKNRKMILVQSELSLGHSPWAKSCSLRWPSCMDSPRRRNTHGFRVKWCLYHCQMLIIKRQCHVPVAYRLLKNTQPICGSSNRRPCRAQPCAAVRPEPLVSLRCPLWPSRSSQPVRWVQNSGHQPWSQLVAIIAT